MSNTVISAEHRKIFKLYPKFESAKMLNKIEMFKEAINETPGTEISNMIWIKSKNTETWLNRRTNYSRSLAVMSIVGYILGLGDRHPSNLMMSRKTGKIIHIDFGDCFEVAMKRDKFPEKVPFRLTRMLVKALEVSGIEGTFRIISEKVMELLRNNNDSLLAILGSFLYDPLISFRLMIPMIVKMKKEQEKLQNSNNDILLTGGINFNRSLSKSLTSKTGILDKYKNRFKEVNNEPLRIVIKGCMIQRNNDNITKKINVRDDNNIRNYKGRRESTLQSDFIKGMEHMTKNKEEKLNDEKKKMEDDERQMFILYEENDEIDEIDSDKLNNIAKIVLNRIHDKLIGTDIRPDTFYDAKSQVDELIKSATSNENLAQSYLGWCPFW
jgi:phosphatidylinositol kinase/protein kinase (PI-3  family)